MKLHLSNTKQEVAEAFSNFFIEHSINSKRITVALSGGSTPKIVFDHLAKHYQGMDWSRFHFFWGDERCVPPTDDESNYKMTMEHLLSKIDVPEDNIHRIKGENDPSTEAVRYADLLKNELENSLGLPQFDIVILGMGDDGHTASIFPHEIDLWDSKELCVLATHPDSGQKRVSITGEIINNARTVVFLITGKGKAEKVKAILDTDTNSRKYPAALVRPTSGDLHGFLDREAYSQCAKV